MIGTLVAEFVQRMAKRGVRQFTIADVVHFLDNSGFIGYTSDPQLLVADALNGLRISHDGDRYLVPSF